MCKRRRFPQKGYELRIAAEPGKNRGFVLILGRFFLVHEGIYQRESRLIAPDELLRVLSGRIAA